MEAGQEVVEFAQLGRRNEMFTFQWTSEVGEELPEDISVIGSFSDWGEIPMLPIAPNAAVVRVLLPAGLHHFRICSSSWDMYCRVSNMYKVEADRLGNPENVIYIPHFDQMFECDIHQSSEEIGGLSACTTIVCAAALHLLRGGDTDKRSIKTLLERGTIIYRTIKYQAKDAEHTDFIELWDAWDEFKALHMKDRTSRLTQDPNAFLDVFEAMRLHRCCACVLTKPPETILLFQDGDRIILFDSHRHPEPDGAFRNAAFLLFSNFEHLRSYLLESRFPVIPDAPEFNLYEAYIVTYDPTLIPSPGPSPKKQQPYVSTYDSTPVPNAGALTPRQPPPPPGESYSDLVAHLQYWVAARLGREIGNAAHPVESWPEARPNGDVEKLLLRYVAEMEAQESKGSEDIKNLRQHIGRGQQEILDMERRLSS